MNVLLAGPGTGKTTSIKKIIETHGNGAKFLILSFTNTTVNDLLAKQKQFTFSKKGRVFHNPQTNKPWETSQQIRRTQWIHILKKSGIRYRNTYQTRHTYASMMLSQGENIMWVSKQLGHVDVEMVIKTYGRWIPDNSSQSGYRPVHNWSSHLG